MNQLFRYTAAVICANIIGWNLLCPAQDSRSTEHREGLRDNRPDSYALINADVVVAPGQKLEKGIVLIKDGKIESVLPAQSKIPVAFRKLDLSGKTIYPGLIDSYTTTEINAGDLERGAPYWNSNIRPQIQAASCDFADADLEKALRTNGFTCRLVVPEGGIIRGVSAFVSTGEGSIHQKIISPSIAQHAILTLQRRIRSSSTSRPSYPNSPMGAVALARQAMYDATWYRKANQAVKANSSLPLPENNDALRALGPVISQNQPLIIDSANELYFLRAHRFANEFNAKAIIKGSGFEFRRIAEIASTGRPIILPVNFPSAPNVSSFESALNVSLETLMEWDHAPENPSRLANAGVTFAFCSEGLSNREDCLKNIRTAVRRGLSPKSALAALTTAPAQMFGVADKLGKISKGMLAYLVVCDGDLFDEETEILETWISGTRYQNEPESILDLEGQWQLKSTTTKNKPIDLQLKIKAGSKSLSGAIELPRSSENKSKQKKAKDKKRSGSSKSDEDDESSNTLKLSKAGVQNNRFSAVFDASKISDLSGMVQMTLLFGESLDEANGFLTFPNGQRTAATLTRLPAKVEESEDQGTTSENKTKNISSRRNNSEKESEPAPAKNDSAKISKASFPVNFPLGANGRSSIPKAETVLIRNVTIWTCGKQGVLKSGSVLIKGGKIAAVGPDTAPTDTKGILVIDGKGMHLTPGIIDCHSHMGSDGGINESGQAITAEVRIGDFINCNDINIYRQLAGGVTTSNILHGSANPIGGQNQVIKLRWGMNDEQMKFKEAPAGIKFALGENVKRSRDSSSSRYPRTRMGVEQIFLDEFRAAQGYEQEWKRWKATRDGLPPRRNLELDAIVEILNRDRWIHCHSYRQDEILALIRLLDGFKIQIGTFQHILEGYKVADAMKKHGAMGSAFADWWAYKFEVYDAIPYAGALMHNAGVVVSFNSDDRELARHLNHEAAKAVKYGGVPPEEALKFVTLNPAKQLRIDQYVGSVEVGKHADLVLWNGDPLSTLSRCEMTWVDGRRMFDRAVDQNNRDSFAQMKQELIQKVLESGETMNSFSQGRPTKPEEMWPSYDEFCRCKGSK